MQQRPGFAPDPNSPQGGYRDDREAALAQAASLQQRNQHLEADNARLHAENASLRAENHALRASGATVPPRRTGVAIVIAALCVLFFVGLLGSLLFLRAAPSSTPPAPSVEYPVPTSVPTPPPTSPMPTPVPTTHVPTPPT